VYLFLDQPSYEEDAFDLWKSEEDDSYEFDEEYPKPKSILRDDSSFYVVADDEDVDLGEEIASSLGKYTKINLEEIHKTFFSVV
jgi:hypothetical protein